MDNKNTVWAFGCSFTADYHPLDNDPPNNYDKYREFRGGNLPDTYPKVLADMLDYDVRNLGVGASSNYHIFRNFCNSVADIKKGDIVIIGWTSILRFILANFYDNTLQNILPNQEYPEYDKNIVEQIVVNRDCEVWNIEILSFMNIIDEFCKLKEVKVFYWTSDTSMLKYWKDNNIYSRSSIIKNTDNGLCLISLNNMRENKYTINDETNGEVDDGHMGEFGHKKQAEIIFNHIKSNLDA